MLRNTDIVISQWDFTGNQPNIEGIDLSASAKVYENTTN
jgi:hypothetical protein